MAIKTKITNALPTPVRTTPKEGEIWRIADGGGHVLVLFGSGILGETWYGNGHEAGPLGTVIATEGTDTSPLGYVSRWFGDTKERWFGKLELTSTAK